MTHDPREALEEMLTAFAEGVCWNQEQRAAYEKAHAALTASPGEQEPVAHRIRVVDGSYCKVIPDGELEIWKQNWSTHLKSGHALLEPLYLSPSPAAGWDIEVVADAIDLARYQPPSNPARTRPRPFSEADRSDREYATRLAKAALKALRREAPAPEGVGPHRERLCRYCGKAHDLFEWCQEAHDAEAGLPSRPDAGGGVRVKPLEWHDNRHAQSILGVYSINSWSSGAFSILRPNKGYPDNNSFPTVEAAKAAAQADYERRILSALSTPPAAAENEADDWRDDPSADERWNAGLDFAMGQFCAALGVDPKSVRWDAATETLDGDVNAVIWNILRARFGEDWDPAAAESNASVEARLREALEPFAKAEYDLSENERDTASIWETAAAADITHGDIRRAKRVYDAISPVGDAAKKSIPVQDAEPASGAHVAGRTGGAHPPTGANPSDPTAERREIVARIVRLFIGAEVQRTEYGVRYSSEAFDKMVGELAALDGGI